MEVPESTHYIIAFNRIDDKQRSRDISRMSMLEEMFIEAGLELTNYAPGFGPIPIGWIVDMKAVTFTRILDTEEWESYQTSPNFMYPLLGDFSVLLQVLEKKKGRVGAKRLGLLD
jgi:hypothetical protein